MYRAAQDGGVELSRVRPHGPSGRWRSNELVGVPPMMRWTAISFQAKYIIPVPQPRHSLCQIGCGNQRMAPTCNRRGHCCDRRDKVGELCRRHRRASSQRKIARHDPARCASKTRARTHRSCPLRSDTDRTCATAANVAMGHPHFAPLRSRFDTLERYPQVQLSFELLYRKVFAGDPRIEINVQHVFVERRGVAADAY